MLDLEGARSPVDVAIIGDAQHLASEIRRLADAGATQFMANTNGITTAVEYRRTLHALGELRGHDEGVVANY